jgi:type IV secretory pathway VirB3-like protein
MSSDTDAACVATALFSLVFKTCQVILMLLVWPLLYLVLCLNMSSDTDAACVAIALFSPVFKHVK